MVKGRIINLTRFSFIIIFVFFSCPLVTTAQENKFDGGEYKIGFTCEDIHKFSWVTPKLNIKNISHSKASRVQVKAAFVLRSLQKAIYGKQISKIECGGTVVNAALYEKILKVILIAGFKESFIFNPDENGGITGFNIILYSKDKPLYTIYMDQESMRIIHAEKAQCNDRSNSIDYEFDYSFGGDKNLIEEISNLCNSPSVTSPKKD